MIVIAGTFRIKPELREEALGVAQALAAASEREAGCISYRFYTSLEDPNTFFVFEQWESEQALADHFQTPHIKEFRVHLPRMLAEPIQVKKYHVSSVGPL